MKKLLIFTVLVTVMSFCTSVLPVNGEAEIYDNVIRLHVLANSDSEEDQALKLEVRDAILSEMRVFMTESSDRTEAQTVIEENRATIEKIASRVVSEAGYDYPVEVALGEEYYPTREYDGVTLPAGNYFSVRVLIGEAQGQNWWCVLFPPLCLGAAKADEQLKEVGFTPEEVNILCENEEPEYVLKFKVLEFFKSCFVKKK